MEHSAQLNPTNAPSPAIPDLSSLIPLLERLLRLLVRLWRHRSHPASYENLRFDLCLTIHDPAGRQATLRRFQTVRFRTAEPGIVRDVTWGEGEQFADYRVDGADLVGVRNEGPNRVALLDIRRQPARHEHAEVSIERSISDGFLRAREYIEAELERPTKALCMRVAFPVGCMPRSARVELSPPSQSSVYVPVELDAAGNPELSWSTKHPIQNTRYRLVWSW